jgi:cytochrome P450
VSQSWPIDSLDPYPDLARLAAAGPIHRLPELNAWLVLSYDLARQVLHGPGWSADPRTSPSARSRMGFTSGDLVGQTVLFSEGEDHRRLRQGLKGLLTPAAVAANQARIEAVVEAAFAGFLAEPGDFMAEVAYAIPLAVICELLDAGEDLALSLRRETPAMTAMLDPLASPDQLEAATLAGIGLTMDVMALVADRSAHPGADLLSQVVARLETEESLAMALLLLVAGHETTASLIGNAIMVLHRRPDLIAALRHEPARVDPLVEELLRYEPPVQLTARAATAVEQLAEERISPGDLVFISLAAANRDPAVYPDPDRFLPGRSGPPHLSFGYGTHFCAGAALARAEIRAVLSQLTVSEQPVSEWELSEIRSPSATFRRLAHLGVTLG